ncbi:hypothetical protein Nepgr_010007 [Nepenthes gracilis]|uniref:Protein kinase domain-containing protein n=1 Tax=Nepenthes gracilis TaxID=150966 RepID=A0AAD3SBU3_NEPGR|nr:hypothetical protein Nepgr_010007 [Nepenthes gracilis]
MEEDRFLGSGCCDFLRLLFCLGRGRRSCGVNCEHPVPEERAEECWSADPVTDDVGERRSDFVGDDDADHVGLDFSGTVAQESNPDCVGAVNEVKEGAGIGIAGESSTQNSDKSGVEAEDTTYLVKEAAGLDISPSDCVGNVNDATEMLFSNQDRSFFGQCSDLAPMPCNILNADAEPAYEQSKLYLLWGDPNANRDNKSGHAQYGKETSSEGLVKRQLISPADGEAASITDMPLNIKSEMKDFDSPQADGMGNSQVIRNSDLQEPQEHSYEQGKLYLLWGNPNTNGDNNFVQGQCSKGEGAAAHTVPNTKLEMKDFGSPLPDCLGNLQIIKYNDLQYLRELGYGTFCAVYHGKWRGCDVAIKWFNDVGEDFWNEAVNLAELRHPNVVAFYGVVLDGPEGSGAIVAEYMLHGSLNSALQNARNLDMRTRLLIALDVAFGMEYLHSKNVVHFDLKSENLLVDLRDPHRPICKIGDLGLSKVRCTALISASFRGTYPWMAPELLNSTTSLVSEKVDVFSFGMVMWELVSGEQPHADLDYDAIIGGVLCNTLRPPVPYYCDPGWRSLMERCWSHRPCERPSFSEIALELRAMIA